jgi:bifunctional non-homologous end joining protein LigD
LVKISNRDRVIFPDTGITKGQLADYYAAVAPIMLPWAGSRPISLVRCPQGRAKKCFFQKHDAGMLRRRGQACRIAEKDGHEEPYLFVDTADGLLTCVQMGTIEFHGWGARIEDVEKADRLVFDLDPDEGLDFEAVRKAAFHFRDILKSIGLETFPMVTGGKGIHVIAPLVPRAEWPEVKELRAPARAGGRAERSREFHRRVAQGAAQGPDLRRLSAQPARRDRRHALCVRARSGAPVAAPITWKEMETIDSRRISISAMPPSW